MTLKNIVKVNARFKKKNSSMKKLLLSPCMLNDLFLSFLFLTILSISYEYNSF